MQTFLVEEWFGVTIGTVSTIENQLATAPARKKCLYALVAHTQLRVGASVSRWLLRATAQAIGEREKNRRARASIDSFSGVLGITSSGNQTFPIGNFVLCRQAQLFGERVGLPNSPGPSPVCDRWLRE